MRKQVPLLSILLLFTMLLTACGGEAPSQPSGQTGSSGEAVTLRYGFWGEGQKMAMEQIIQEFNKTHPNIKVEIEATPSKQYWTKMETAATGGSTPDVFWMNGPRFVKFAANDILMPLDDLIKADNVDMSKYPEALVKLYNNDGKQYALPKDFDTVALWYNKELFDAAGVKYPDETWTWETFREAAKKLTNPEKGVWGVVAPPYSQEGFYNTIPQSGGFVISEDKKTSGYDKPEAIAGLKFWTDMIADKSSPTQEQMTDTEPVKLFESGKVAMMYNGSWMALEFAQNEYTKDKVDLTVLPQGKERATVIHGLGYAISANTQHPKEAWEFVKFLGGKQAADIQANTGTVIPAYEGTQEAWVKSLPQFNLKAYIDELAYAKPYPVSKNTSAWTQIEEEILIQVWSGKLSVEEGAKQLAQKMNEALAAEE